MHRRGRGAVLGAALLVLGGAAPSLGQRSWPRITAVSPSGGQRGTTVELAISGTNVGLATEVLFEGTGLTVEALTPEKPAAPAEGAKASGPPKNAAGKVVARVRIAPDAEPGIRALRVLTPAGPSDLASFVVGAWPEVAEREPNNSRDTAQELSFPATLSGLVNPAEDVEYFRFRARAGKTLLFDVLAARLGSPLDSLLAIQDASGEEIALNEDHNGMDSFLAFTPPADGDYFLVLRDLRYRGGAGHSYRLSMGEIPYVTALFPPGGQRGAKLQVELAGFNLGTGRSAQITLPAGAPRGVLPMVLPLPSGPSNPVLVAVGDVPEAVEAEPNDEAAQAQPLPVPGTANGRIDTRPASRVARLASEEGQGSSSDDAAPDTGRATRDARRGTDVDSYRFRAAKDEKLLLEIEARPVGSELDSLLVVLDAAGKEVAVNDDGAGKDSRLEFTAPATGEYVAQVRDLHDRQGPGYTYRLRIAPLQPDFTLAFTPDHLGIGPGGRLALTVTAQRLNGFEGEIALAVEGLPEGVSVAGPARIRAGQTEANLVLAAAPGAKAALSPFCVRGSVTTDGKTVTREARGTVAAGRSYPNGAPLVVAAVTEPPVLDVTAAPERLTLAPNKSVDVAVKVERREGFKGKVPLAVLGLPRGVTATTPDIAEDKAEATVTLKAEGRAAPAEMEILIAARLHNDAPAESPVTLPIVLTIAPAEQMKR